MDLATLIMKISGGLIRTREQALLVLLGIAILFVVISIVIMSADPTVPNRNPHTQKLQPR